MKSAPAFSEDLLADHRAFRVLEKAVSRNHLAQSVLLHGEDIHLLEQVSGILAAHLLQTHPERLNNHPDVFHLRTRGKARQINIGSAGERTRGEWPPNTMRRFLHDLHLSPQAGPRKVGIVVEADRMNDSTANAFLKTLEEPPADTTLFLLTTRPYDLLDTIRSRCLNFRLPASLSPAENPVWAAWKGDYRAWLASLVEIKADRQAVAHATLSVYALTLRFEAILSNRSDESWKDLKQSLPEHLSEEELAALETGLAKGLRQQMFAEIEEATRHFALEKRGQHGVASFRPLTRAVEKLERLAWLVDRVNLQENAALEVFLLESLRLWTQR